MGRQSTAKSEARRRPIPTAARTLPRDPESRTATKSATGKSATKKGAARKQTSKKAAKTPAPPAPRAAWIQSLDAAWAGVRREVKRVDSYPLTTYYIILVSVLALTALGLVMVLSASSITSYDGGEGSSFSVFNRQAVFAGVGLVLMIVAVVVPAALWKKLAWWALILAIGLQAAVFLPGLGKTVKGNANWIQLPGGLQIQPSEFLKIALAVWLGFILAQKFGKMHTFGRAMIPIVPGLAIAIGLVVAGNDLGTGLVLIGVSLVCLFIGGYPWKYFILLGVSASAVVAAYIFSSANRLARFEALLTGHADQTAEDVMGQQWQTNHGLFSLASGGWFGVGLGASREKWSWLPEAHNDFIFAIIGEELGLVGSFVVLVLFTALAYGLVRVIMRSNDMFVQISVAGLFMWLIGQAAINICVVIGLLPVIGLPLPFVSYGGSSLIAGLLAVGVILSFARAEDGARAAIRAHKDRLRASFAVLARQRKK